MLNIKVRNDTYSRLDEFHGYDCHFFPSGHLWQKSLTSCPWAEPGPPFAFVHKILLEHRQTHLSACCVWQLSHYNCSWAVATQTMWPSELKIFSIWPCTEKFFLILDLWFVEIDQSKSHKQVSLNQYIMVKSQRVKFSSRIENCTCLPVLLFGFTLQVLWMWI